MSDDDEIRRFIAKRGVTMCPPAAVAPTSATIASNGLADAKAAQSHLATKMHARRCAKGRTKWLQGKSRKLSDRRARL